MYKKLVTAAALGALLVPALASAETARTAVTAEMRDAVKTRASVSPTPPRGETATTTALTRATDLVRRQALQIQKTADLMSALGTKLSMRAASSTDSATTAALIADLNAHIADMRLQASAALGHVEIAAAASTTKTNSTAELKKARADIVVARKDIENARKDIDKILKALRVANMGAYATSTVETR